MKYPVAERRQLESKFYFGDRVTLRLSWEDNAPIVDCIVVGIRFTIDKVCYDLQAQNGQFLKDIDSAYCE